MKRDEILQHAFRGAVSVAAFLVVALLADIKKQLEPIQQLQIKQAVTDEQLMTLRGGQDEHTVRIDRHEVRLTSLEQVCAALKYRSEIKPGR